MEVAFIFTVIDFRRTGTMEIGRLLVQIRILEVLSLWVTYRLAVWANGVIDMKNSCAWSLLGQHILLGTERVDLRIDHRFLRFHPVLLRQEHIDKCCLQALRSRNTFCKSPIDRDTEMRGSFGPDFGCCFGNALRQCGGNQWVVENAVLEKVLRLQRVGVTL